MAMTPIPIPAGGSHHSEDATAEIHGADASRPRRVTSIAMWYDRLTHTRTGPTRAANGLAARASSQSRALEAENRVGEVRVELSAHVWADSAAARQVTKAHANARRKHRWTTSPVDTMTKIQSQRRMMNGRIDPIRRTIRPR